jgi:hypothetical protein
MTTEFTESEPHRLHVDDSTAATKASPPRPTITAMPICNIRVGYRIRRDLGDIDGLAQNIDAIGLLNPLAVWSDGTCSRVRGGWLRSSCSVGKRCRSGSWSPRMTTDDFLSHGLGPEMKGGALSTDAMNKNDRDGQRKNPGAGAPAQ